MHVLYGRPKEPVLLIWTDLIGIVLVVFAVLSVRVMRRLARLKHFVMFHKQQLVHFAVLLVHVVASSNACQVIGHHHHQRQRKEN